MNEEHHIQMLKLETHLNAALEEMSKPDRSMATGIPSLDKLMGGLHPSDLVIIAGRPSMGKTALATDILLKLGEKYNPLVFSLEMSSISLVYRMITNLTGIATKKLYNNSLTAEEQVTVDKTMKLLSGYNIFIDGSSTSVPVYMKKKIQSLLDNGHKIDCVIIDYLQLITLLNPQENRNQELASITRQLKAIAKHFDIPVILISQLNRKVDYREGKRPMMSDLRDSGAIEQDADIILLLYRPGYYSKLYNPSAVDNGETEIIVAKQRNGETGVATCIWNEESMSFINRLKLNLGNF